MIQVPPQTNVSLSSISVNIENAATSYKIGDTFSTDGITVTATYTDNTTKDVTSSAKFSTPDMSAEGTPEVTVSYTEGSVTKTATFSISVSATGETIVALSSIDVTSNPTLSWYTNQEFSTSGMTVTATYTDKTTKEVTSSVKVTLTDSDGNTVAFDSLTAGTLKATVSYTEGSITKTANFSVAVTKYELYSIKIDTSNAKTTFTKNGTFSSTGLTVTATYTDNTTADVTSNANTSGYDMSTTGTQTVTVSYTEDEVTKTATYTILVQEALPYTVSGSVAKDTAVPPLAVSSETGASVSFILDLATAATDATYEWETPLKIVDASDSNTIYIDVGPLGIWLAEGGNNLFENSAIRGSDFTAENWTIFCQDGNSQYVTINFDTDGNITYYKNGKAALTYVASTIVKDSVKVSDGCAKTIEILASNGCTLATTLDDAEFSLSNVTVKEALTSDEAEKQFLTACTDIAITAEDVSFIKDASFNTKNVSVSGKLGGETLDLTSYATIDSSAVNTAAAGTYSVKITCGNAEKTYSVEVKDFTVGSLTITTQPTKTAYTFITDNESVTWEPDLTGMVVTAYDTSDTTHSAGVVIENSELTVDKIKSTSGTQNLAVKYDSVTSADTVTVTVTAAKVVDKGFSTSFSQTGADWTATNPMAGVDIDADSGFSISYAYSDLAAEGCDTKVIADCNGGNAAVQLWNAGLCWTNMGANTWYYCGSADYVKDGCSWATMAGSHYVTLSCNTDGSMVCYVDGEKTFGYNADAVINENTNVKVSQIVNEVITAFTDSSKTANLTPVTGLTLSNVVFTRAVTDAEAATIYETYGKRTE